MVISQSCRWDFKSGWASSNKTIIFIRNICSHSLDEYISVRYCNLILPVSKPSSFKLGTPQRSSWSSVMGETP